MENVFTAECDTLIEALCLWVNVCQCFDTDTYVNSSNGLQTMMVFWLNHHQGASNVYKLLAEGVMRPIPQLQKVSLRASHHVFRILQTKLETCALKEVASEEVFETASPIDETL